jgi:oxygen-independent coproporphyrinogen-3 oxidase
LVDLGLLQRVGLARADGATWRGNELDEIALCLGPGVPPEQPPEARPTRCEPFRQTIRATPRGRFVLNAVVAELAASFSPVTPELFMDNRGAEH